MTTFADLSSPDFAVPSQAYHAQYMVGPARICSECHSHMSDADEGARHGIEGCDDCLCACERCDAVCIRDETISVMRGAYGDFESWCAYCAEQYTASCEHCYETFPRVELQRNRGINCLLCFGCAESQREREEEEAAEEDEGSGVIGDYHNRDRRLQTRPVPSSWTRQNGNRFIGVELEVEAGEGVRWRDVESTAGDLLESVNEYRAPLLWAERDGSLSNGFELITQPMGLDRQAELWTKVLSRPSASGLRSHNTSTCGLHVHISRAGLSQLTIAKVIVFMNDIRNADLVAAIARRYDTGYSKQKTVRLSKRATVDPDRYVMVNTLPEHTIEFRVFRGSTKLETVLGCIEFANAVTSFCRDSAPSSLTTTQFVEWLNRPANLSDSKHLRATLARRAPAMLGKYLPKPNTRTTPATSTTSEE